MSKKALVLKSFVGTLGGITVNAAEGQVIDLPEGTDWVQAGLVQVLDAPVVETAVALPTERAVKKTARRAGGSD